MSKHDIDIEREVMGLNDEDADHHKRWAEGMVARAVLRRDWCSGSAPPIVRGEKVICTCGYTIPVDPATRHVVAHLVTGVILDLPFPTVKPPKRESYWLQCNQCGFGHRSADPIEGPDGDFAITNTMQCPRCGYGTVSATKE